MAGLAPEGQEAFVFPASHAQARLWFLDQVIAEPAVYNIPLALRLRGPLQVEALRESLRQVARRHESLRTTFRWLEGQPHQVIAAEGNIELALVDAAEATAEASGEDREVRGLALAREEARRPFDLKAGPLLRATLFRVAPEVHILVLCMHHIVSDGWSMALLLQELKACYRAVCLGEAPSLPALPVQVADVSQWQREQLQGALLERQLAYWRRQLEGVPVLLDLPQDHARPPISSHRGAHAARSLPRSLAEALKALARQEGVTLFMTLLAGFQLLLARTCGQEDLVVGSPIAGRMRPEVAPLIGLFVNMLALRTDLSGEPTVRELLGRVRTKALGAFQHQDLPFEGLVEALNPPRSRSHAPLFQVMFVLQNDPRTDATFLDLEEQGLDLDAGFSMFDLGLSMWESDQGLEARLDYATDLFDAATAERLLELFQRVLEGMAAAPEQRIARLPLLSEAERHRLLVTWNETARELPDLPVHALFEAQAARSPAAIALVLGARSLTYADLNARANQIAHGLRRRGVGPGVTVAVLMERSLELIAGLLGILKAGGAYVPLDPAHPAEQLAFVLEDAGARFLLTHGDLLEGLPDCAVTAFRLDLDRLAESPEPTTNPPVQTGPEDLAYVMYTSGSTGRPKGVEILHRGIVRLVFGLDCVQLDGATRILQAAPAAFDAATFEIWGPLLHGGRCVLYPEARISPAILRRELEDHRINTLWLTSALFNAIIHHAPETLRGVRQLLIGGEALSVRHVRRALDLLPETRIINGYGPTEATTFSCCHPIPLDLDEGVRSVPIGRPIGNSTAFVLDPRGEPVPVGVTGELHLGGLGLARGYRNLPGLTAAAFLPDPFSSRPGARLYRTGDLARRLPDGTLEFLGRRDAQVKIRGHRIELGEIEAVLAQYPGVPRSVVDVREDATGGKRIVAYLEAPQRNDLAFTVEGLGDFLRRKLPHYMVPDTFAVLDALPMKNGKLDRGLLRELPLGCATPRQHLSPSNPTQMLIAQIWEELLDVRPIGILDDFFDLGGHSLLVFAMLARLEEVFGRKLPIASLYANATIQSLYRLLTDGASELEETPLAVVQAGGARRPFFFLHGDYNGGGFYCRNLAQHLAPDQPFLVLHPFGLAGQPLPVAMEAMAAAHLQLLRAVQPEGPYLLGGYCNGALEAFEIAQQLVAAGQQVDLLLMIDPPAPDPSGPAYPRDASLDPADPGALPHDQRQELLFRRFLHSIANYRPGPYPGTAVFFRSGEQLGAGDATQQGWNRLIPAIERFDFPGGHLSTLTKHVADIGRRMQACLDAVDLG
ncbi:MAG: amino acid adenylation domain-containing protein [Holophagaceae bacterium]|nr:amino acid adenylation domain-containing protein [Holophagaceae bacterium]